MDFLNKEDSNGTLIDFIKNRKKFNGNSDEGSTQKQQILEELHVSTKFIKPCFKMSSFVIQY